MFLCFVRFPLEGLGHGVGRLPEVSGPGRFLDMVDILLHFLSKGSELEVGNGI